MKECWTSSRYSLTSIGNLFRFARARSRAFFLPLSCEISVFRWQRGFYFYFCGGSVASEYLRLVVASIHRINRAFYSGGVRGARRVRLEIEGLIHPTSGTPRAQMPLPSPGTLPGRKERCHPRDESQSFLFALIFDVRTDFHEFRH